MSDELRARGFDLPDEIVGRTVFDLIARQAERRPAALALCATSIFGGEHQFGYGDDAFADRLANGATQAIRWTKTTVNIALKQLAHSMMDTGLAYEALTNISDDHKRLVRAFRERSAAKPPAKAAS
ncbi:MAG: hypothetical protein ACTHNN_11530 [Xanthobacteraceae bacterium]